ncbi:carbonic anhydrase [Xylogone sp. PMI_703]|nr:carbonic anhydrase [Xylogone sp. PMI_703]
MKDFLSSVRYHTEVVPTNYISLPSPSTHEHLEAFDEKILWVGCSDSNINETDILDVPRDELFVHRNLGNQLSNGDVSSLCAVQVCVDEMQVRHIIVCGHYGCGLINEAGDTNSVQSWLHHLKELRELCSLFFPKENGVHKHSHLVELNVLVQMAWLMQQPNVVKAVEERGMEVHGFIYNQEKGECVRLVVDGMATGPSA